MYPVSPRLVPAQGSGGEAIAVDAIIRYAYYASMQQYESLGFLLADATRLFRRAMQMQLSGSSLTLAQARALAHAAREPGIRQVDLADRLDIQPITLVRVIDQLAAEGLLERQPDPADRRAWRLFPTASAQPLLESFRKASALLEREAFHGLNEETRELALSALALVRQNLGACKPDANDP